MNDQTEVLPTPLQQESFDVVLRGYSRGQVDEYVKRIKRQLDDLGTRTTQAERAAEESRRDRDLLRSELTAANQKLERAAPTYEDFGKRLAHILTLAQEEADEIRSNSEAEAQRVRTEAEQSVQGLRRQVQDQHDAAQAEADRMRTEAQQEAQRVRTEAEESAQQVQREAEERAQRLVSEAEESSSQRERTAQHRVEELEAQQTQLLARLSEVRDSLQTMLPGQAAAVESALDSAAGPFGRVEPKSGTSGSSEEHANGEGPGAATDETANIPVGGWSGGAANNGAANNGADGEETTQFRSGDGTVWPRRG